MLFLPSIAFADVCAINPFPGSNYGGDAIGQGTNVMVAYPFTLSASCDATALGVGYAYIGTAVDDLIPQIFTDVAGVPGVSLASGSAVPVVGSAGANLYATSSISISLTAGDYWVVWTRSGAQDVSNYWIAIGPNAAGSSQLSADGVTWAAGNDQYSFELDDGSSTPPFVSTSTDATSTVDQAEQNFANGIYIFIAMLFFTIWIFKK